MLLNPHKDRPTPIQGTRILEETFGLMGVRIPDPYNVQRAWEVQGVYLPVGGRALGGIRTKVTDQKGFVSFCNQRDLEVLLGLSSPGSYCFWANCAYVGPEDTDWYGLCCDDEDLRDDLFDREMFLRAQTPSGVLLPTPAFDIQRRVHLGRNQDVEDLFVLLQDADPDTGCFPDTRFETLERRWSRAERVRVRWERS